MKRIRAFFRITYRFIVLWLVDVFSLWITSLLIPGITLQGGGIRRCWWFLLRLR